MLIRHSAIYIVAKVVPGVLGMATTALLTRVLAPADYGLYSLALLVMSFGASLAFDWLGLAYVRVAQKLPDRLLAASTFAHIYAGLVVGTAAVALIAAIGGGIDPARAGVLCAGLLMAWSYSWFELVSSFHIANLKPRTYLRMNLGRAVLTLLGAGGAAFFTGSAIWTAYGTAAAMLLGALIGGFGRYRLGPRGFDRDLARSTLHFGLPLAASLALTGLIGSGTRAILDWLGSIEALGLYTAAFVLVQNTLGVIAAGIASAGFSLAVRAVDSGDPVAAHRQLEANGTLLLAVLAPCAVGMALTASSIAATLVGPRYVVTVAVLTPWMAFGALFAGFRAHYLEHAFQLGRQPHGQIWVTAGCVLVTLALDLVLIPRFGPLGAAIAIAGGAASSLLHAIWAGREAYPLPLPAAAAWRIGLACLALSAGVWLVPGAGPLVLVMQVALGGACYVAAALALDLLSLRAPTLALLARGLRRNRQAA